MYCWPQVSHNRYALLRVVPQGSEWPPILLSIYVVPSGHLMRRHNNIFHSYEDGVHVPWGASTQNTVLHMCFCDCTYFSWVHNHITTLWMQILSSLNYWCTCKHAHWEIVSVCAVCSLPSHPQAGCRGGRMLRSSRCGEPSARWGIENLADPWRQLSAVWSPTSDHG